MADLLVSLFPNFFSRTDRHWHVTLSQGGRVEKLGENTLRRVSDDEKDVSTAETRTVSNTHKRAARKWFST